MAVFLDSYLLFQRHLSVYKNERHGPTMIAVQSPLKDSKLASLIPVMRDFPLVPLYRRDPDNFYAVLEWQRVRELNINPFSSQ